MSDYEVVFYPAADRDMAKLEGSRRRQVFKALEKVKGDPLPQDRGGYGKPLGNKSGADLAGYMKTKLRGSGIRIVYRLVELRGRMAVIVVGAREDGEAYALAARRRAEFEKWLDGLG